MRKERYTRISRGYEAPADLVRRQFLASKGKPQLKTRADAGAGQGIYALPSFRDRIKPKAHGEAAHKAPTTAKNMAFYRQIRSKCVSAFVFFGVCQQHHFEDLKTDIKATKCRFDTFTADRSNSAKASNIAPL